MLKNRKILSNVSKVAVAVVSLVLVREQFSKDLFLEFLQSPSLFFILVGMWIINQFLVSWRLDKLFTQVKCKIPYLSLVRATFVSLLFSSVLPGVVGADLAKVVLIRSKNPDTSLSLIGSGIFLDRVLGMVTLILISIFASLFLPISTYTPAQRQMVYMMWLVGLGLMGIWLLALLFQRWFSKLEISDSTPGYRFKIVRRAIEMIKLWRLPLSSQLSLLLISSVAVGIIALVQALIAGYLLETNNLPFNFALTMFIFPTLTVVSALPITPLGLGIGQLAIGHAFKLFGLPAEIGVAVATLSQLSQALVSLLCGGALFWLKRPSTKVSLDSETRQAA